MATFRQTRCNLSDCCCCCLPCLFDDEWRKAWELKAAVVLLHVLPVGALFLFDVDLVEKTKKEPWYTLIYLLLCTASLVQYFVTSYSSPGYLIDAMRVDTGSRMVLIDSKTQKHPASKNATLVSTVGLNQLSRPSFSEDSSSWSKLVKDLYPPGSSSRNWTCSYCGVIQPPRCKHCHDCGKCVLQFDHHCVWLGTCIGQGNHCRFWWYIFEETILCAWTGMLYIMYLQKKTTKTWEAEAIMITLLVLLIVCLIFLLLLLLFHSYLIITNQTTYELVRRRRIRYLRDIPETVHPFSKGICRNVYEFCCSGGSIYTLESVPTLEEVHDGSRAHTRSSRRCCV